MVLEPSTKLKSTSARTAMRNPWAGLPGGSRRGAAEGCIGALLRIGHIHVRRRRGGKVDTLSRRKSDSGRGGGARSAQRRQSEERAHEKARVRRWGCDKGRTAPHPLGPRMGETKRLAGQNAAVRTSCAETEGKRGSLGRRQSRLRQRRCGADLRHQSSKSAATLRNSGASLRRTGPVTQSRNPRSRAMRHASSISRLSRISSVDHSSAQSGQSCGAWRMPAQSMRKIPGGALARPSSRSVRLSLVPMLIAAPRPPVSRLKPSSAPSPVPMRRGTPPVGTRSEPASARPGAGAIVRSASAIWRGEKPADFIARRNAAAATGGTCAHIRACVPCMVLALIRARLQSSALVRLRAARRPRAAKRFAALVRSAPKSDAAAAGRTSAAAARADQSFLPRRWARRPRCAASAWQGGAPLGC